MSKSIPRRPRIVDGKRTFFIVASQFNPRYVQGLVDNAKKELRVLAPRATISVKRVPGAFEIPVVVRELASQGKVDAIISMAKGPSGSRISGNFVRQHHAFASLPSHSSKEWSHICRKSMNGFGVIAQITKSVVSRQSIVTFSGSRSTRCFIATTSRRL